MSELPKIISVDDHVIEPPRVWQDRLPRKYLDIGPRIVRAPFTGLDGRGGAFTVIDDGTEGRPTDWWYYEDLRMPHVRSNVAVGMDRDDVNHLGITYEEMRPGCYQQAARLADMDVNWTEASLCFPTFPRFCGQTFNEAKDRELALLCVQAYNDWMVDEWCGGTGGRLIPLCLIPLWDPHLAAAEVRRNATRGVHAVAFSEMPPFLGMPSVHDPDRYWDPFFTACDETSTVVNMHIGSSSKMPSTSTDAPAAVGSTITFANAMMSLSDYLFSGLFVRYENLKVAYSESQVGWIPYVLERADKVWLDNRGWNDVWGDIPEPPSHYYRDHVFGCVFDDEFGLLPSTLERVGVDNVTFETDYPHSDGTWPLTKMTAEKLFDGQPDDVVEKILRGNAIRMLSLDL